MQAELSNEDLTLEVKILGINAAGSEGGNALICEGRDLPWLQDTAEQNVWGSWDIVYRDVVVLDGENKVVDVYNLTEHDLSVQANYDALKSILRSAAD